ncbi:MAG TPA: hypothetical protein VEB60_00785 [Candidatus Paceibacterota bacterium]|nr:hypothetical protein [Candidatus Paceibacterota bacterium]
MKYFTKDFWKMAAGLSLIIGLGLLGMNMLNRANSAAAPTGSVKAELGQR